MSGINLLNIAKDGLLAHQTAIDLTGSNITNVNTPGYTRQRPVFTSRGCTDVGAGQVQVGVGIKKIERVYDRFLGAQINDKMHDLGYSEAKKGLLEKTEIIFNESNAGGINELLNKFWNAWGDLSANPTGQAEREALLSASQSLASTFRSSSDELVSVQNDANTEIAGLVHQVNGYIADIADLNKGIAAIKTGEGDANDLRDKRAEAIKSLAKILDFQQTEGPNGSVNISLSNGMPLVEGDRTWNLDVETNSTNHPDNPNFYDVIFQNDPDKEVLNDTIKKGKIAGSIEVRDVKIVNYMDNLNKLAASIIDKVNTQHHKGYDLVDPNNPSGEDFFEPATVAKDMRVSSKIVENVNKIAASAEANSVDGGNAEIMEGLKDKLIMNGDTSTFNSYYASLVGNVGQDLADETRQFDHHTNLMSQLTNKREGISGVSIDEEMINLTRYRLGYNSAAKLCGIAGKLIDTLLNMVQ
ncbi:MAG: flagellar hook-associated protein FlgK [Nitrospiraceae bacterium]|nr:flagellar hook-associated protein FlgK [Nitrospiraceae bacterium]